MGRAVSRCGRPAAPTTGTVRCGRSAPITQRREAAASRIRQAVNSRLTGISGPTQALSLDGAPHLDFAGPAGDLPGVAAVAKTPGGASENQSYTLSAPLPR
jgi:hypothetical protein